MTFGEATSPAAAARVDHLEVYAVSKAAFGWDREVALARRDAAGRRAGDKEGRKANEDETALSDAEDKAESTTSKTASRLERVVRHKHVVPGSRPRGKSRAGTGTREEERALRAALASLARAAASEASADVKETAAALALEVLEPDLSEERCFFSDSFDQNVWTPSVATRRVAWQTLLAVTGDPVAAAARKDAAVIQAVSERVTRLAGVPARRGPAPADALAFHRAARAAARCAFRRPAAFAASPAARAASATMARLARTRSRRARAPGTPRSSPGTSRRSPSPSPSRRR